MNTPFLYIGPGLGVGAGILIVLVLVLIVAALATAFGILLKKPVRSKCGPSSS